MAGSGILTVNGNCTTLSSTGTAGTAAIYQSSGTVIVNGIASCNSSNASSYVIQIIGGITYINGNISTIAGTAIASSAAISLFIIGNVTASATGSAISLTSGSAQVFLKGNMINNAGKMAIYAPRIWVDKDTAMYSQFFTSGGADRTLYSADTFPNTPIPANVRSGITFGPDNSLTGTLIIPPTNTVAQGVQVDNTIGTALLTVQEILDEIKNSSDSMAIRLRNSITPEIMGKLLQWAKI